MIPGWGKFTAGKEPAFRMFGPGPFCEAQRPGQVNIYLLRR
jgi:hypothetical protein